ncbi:hypothetical protein M422DRAFT_778210 [Sphaerobolus stellatus SS14]|nr:hypothetical protein M422DRAFT_778210 [Sphaerobolus stellatus SS14]
MSLGDDDAKFPSVLPSNDIPPSPTRENPGAVYPRSSPTPATPLEVPGTGKAPSQNPSAVFGNPYVFEAAIGKLENSLDEIIETIDKEAMAGAGVDISPEEKGMLEKFRAWRQELDIIRGAGRPKPSREPRDQPDLQEGGMFTD